MNIDTNIIILLIIVFGTGILIGRLSHKKDKDKNWNDFITTVMNKQPNK
jgi:hypothetical protein